MTEYLFNFEDSTYRCDTLWEDGRWATMVDLNHEPRRIPYESYSNKRYHRDYSEAYAVYLLNLIIPPGR